MKELDVVLLKDGRKATILEDYGEEYMVEIADKQGRTNDILIVLENEIEKIIYVS